MIFVERALQQQA